MNKDETQFVQAVAQVLYKVQDLVCITDLKCVDCTEKQLSQSCRKQSLNE